MGERFKVMRLNANQEDSPLVVIDYRDEKMFISESDDDALDYLSYSGKGVDPSELCNGILCEYVESDEINK